MIVALAVALLLATGYVGAATQDHYRQRDFSSLYHGGRLVTRIDVYDDVAWCREARGSTFGAVGPHGEQLCPAVFLYPLWTAVVLWPLGNLPLEDASSLWLAISIGAALLGARWCWLAVRGNARSAPIFAALVFASEPFWLMLGGGQLGGVLLLAVGLGAWLMANGRERASGATLAILALKPHVLGLAALAWLARALARRSYAFILAAIAAVTALLLISLPFDLSWPVAWLRESFTRQTGYSPTLATAWGLAAHDLGAVAAAPLLVVALVAAVLWLARGIPRDPVTFSALAVPVALFATPYAWSYDFLPLALPWAFVVSSAGRASASARRTLLAALVVVASLAPWLLYALAFQRGAETLSALVPASAAILAATAARIEPVR